MLHDARLRIIDANANRAREALRVMEDAARFVLDDAELSAAVKSLRHSLREAIDAAAIDPAALLAWRDTPGDVGASVSTPTEYARDGISGVVAAACKRLTEALRSIEECVKGPGHEADGAARTIESMRYRAYELERRLLAALPLQAAAADTPLHARRPGPPRQWRLCVLITEALCEHLPWQEVARECLLGGADCLQLREKSLDDAELLRRARLLVQLTREISRADSSPDGQPRAAVVINDRPDIAVLAGADGVHVGQADLPVREVRKLVGRSLLVGVSTGAVEQARQACRDGADYIGVGPMFPTTTKHKPVIAGPALLQEVASDAVAARLPHLAIGGITPENVGDLSRAGAKGIAVSSAVQKGQRPAVACRALLDGLASTH